MRFRGAISACAAGFPVKGGGMAAKNFDDRIAALEEHIVRETKTADDFLARAEQNFAAGRLRDASWDLSMARGYRSLERIDAMLDRVDDDDA